MIMNFPNFISAQVAVILIGFSVLILPLNVHAEESLKSEETGKSQAEEVKKETEEAIQKTADYAEGRFAEYQNKLKSLSEDYLEQIQQLEKRAKVSGSEMKAEIKKQIDDLNRNRVQIENKLEQLQQLPQQALGGVEPEFDDVESEFDKAIQSFEDSLEEAKARYETS